MPLKPGHSRKRIAKNIEDMREAGYPEEQAVAAAMRVSHSNPKTQKHFKDRMGKAVKHLEKESRS